jgi:calcium-dependent protein kinase
MKIINKPINKKYDEEKLLKEVNILIMVDHPNIIKVLEFYKNGSNFYIITELLTGGELFSKISNSKYLEESSALYVMKQIFSAVNYCHKNGIFHRDLKPENILIEECYDNMYNIKIIDFGTSEIFKKDKTFHHQIGTSYYIAPEVLKNKYNHKCDLWSCGVIMYILLSGSPPFYGKNEEEILQSVEIGKFEFRSRVWKNISDTAKDLIVKLLELDVDKRLSAEQALQHPWVCNLNDSFETQNESFFRSEAPKLSLKKVVNNMTIFSTIKNLQRAAIYYLIHHFSKVDEVREFKNIFIKFDKDKDGKLTRDEFIQGIKECKFINIADSKLDTMVTNIDIDQNGFIEYEEFLAATCDVKSLLTEENLKIAFNFFDKDQSGKITVEELRNILELERSKDKGVMKKLIDDNDLDGDGQISFEEFKKMMMSINK